MTEPLQYQLDNAHAANGLLRFKLEQAVKENEELRQRVQSLEASLWFTVYHFNEYRRWHP